MNIQRIAITPGEPGGVGFDCLIDMAFKPQLSELVVIADPAIIENRALKIGKQIKLSEFNPAQPAAVQQLGHLNVLPVAAGNKKICGAGDPANAHYVLQTLQLAVRGCQQNDFAAMVTGPVNKAVINQAGIQFSGHTEYLAALTQTRRVVMMLAAEQLRVALDNTHCPLREVAEHIRSNDLSEILDIIHTDLSQRFAIDNPRIVVCGLNPHAGENGHLGREEIEIITPVIQAKQQQNYQIIGPVAADTAFTPQNITKADAVLAMYHDQGLPVIKHLGFGKAVNITLGLPIIRTSVDHGTAFDLAGTGNANSESLQYAVNMAQQLIENSHV